VPQFELLLPTLSGQSVPGPTSLARDRERGLPACQRHGGLGVQNRLLPCSLSHL